MNTLTILAAFIISTLWVLVIAYLIGCISPSSILAKRAGKDIRSEGSGNAGTTNALRVMGAKAGVITLIVDILKGALAVALGWHFGGQPLAMLCVPAVFVGHVWPVFYGFKGGKGVATLFGAITCFNWVLGLSALGVVALLVAISRRMSVGSLAGAVALPVLSIFIEPTFLWTSIIVAVIVIIKHRENIIRLKNGEEPKLGSKK